MAWGTRLLASLVRDPFERARLRMTLYYLVFCSVVFYTGGFIVDHYAHVVLLQSFADPVLIPPDEAIARIDRMRWMTRAVYIVSFTIGAYFLMGLALRPMRDAMESERRFIANISHELRTPLTVAKAETEMLLRKPERLDLPRAISGLRKNLEDINNVSRIIQFLLVLSDYSARSKDARQPLVLKDVIREAEDHAARLLDEKRITLAVSLPEDGVPMRGNPVALEKMLLNLIRNAAIYSPEGSSIEVSATRSEKGNITLMVADQGSGMSPADLRHAFEPFYRGMNALPGGTGLGLTIVREVARLHGASIRAESIEGMGTTFFIEFA